MKSVSNCRGRATITVEEAAELLGIGRTAAYEAARRGQLPTRRLGRRLFVPVPAFLSWLGDVPDVPDDPPDGVRASRLVVSDEGRDR
jgi:excisionase family DNA binding protein